MCTVSTSTEWRCVVAEFPALTHVAVTVSDLGRSRDWYQKLFDSAPVLDEDTGPFHHVVWLLGGPLLGIHQHAGARSKEPMAEKKRGRDPIAFRGANRAEPE